MENKASHIKVIFMLAAIALVGCSEPTEKSFSPQKISVVSRSSIECLKDREKIVDAAREIIKISATAADFGWDSTKTHNHINQLKNASQITRQGPLWLKISDCGDSALNAYNNFERVLVSGSTNHQSEIYKNSNLREKQFMDEMWSEEMKKARINLDQELSKLTDS